MAGIINQHQGKALIINGVSDHVHILCSMKSTPDLAKFIKNIKGSSSSWHNAESRLNPIYWQEGYGAFTVSWSQQNRVFKYIENQENHHRRKSFAEEYERFLIKCVWNTTRVIFWTNVAIVEPLAGFDSFPVLTQE